MHLTKKGEYALRALINLGIAQEVGRTHVSVSGFTGLSQLPLKYVEQILHQLRLAGYVDTRRGKYGGYFLRKPMDQIKIGDVVRLLDGPLAPISCASQTAYAPCSCPDEAHCGLRMLMVDVRNAIANILDRYSLADVVEVTMRRMRRDKVALPFSRPELAAKKS
jgi:Rrf2 family protein